MTQMVKNLAAVQETRVRSLGREDSLEEGMVTRSSILAWRISWTEESGGRQSMGSYRVVHDRSDLARKHIRKTPGELKWFALVLEIVSD